MALLQAAAGGDQRSVRRLLDEAGPTVYGFVLARVGGDRAAADDIVQDTFVEAVKSAAGYRGDAAITTWLCAIARRRLARHYEAERRAAAVTSASADAAVTAAPMVEEEAVDRRDEVVRALGRLSAIHRQVLVRKYLDGWSVAEIATEVGRTRVQVQSLLQRARDGLRSELDGARA